uniref:Uncharacterized protein n=1 Tax=Lotharella globosa TaxID=91324 RepID=A0A7S4DWJ8_9EUKA|mmetsp:Transcript_22605/g.45418  ORF Transcript_22605/g.45418 Transcript_22605/m.45418 type:complete len:313 (+) Transcript_22605:75-1013(+)
MDIAESSQNSQGAQKKQQVHRKTKGTLATISSSERGQLRQFILSGGDACSDQKARFLMAPSLADAQFAVIAEHGYFYDSDVIGQWMTPRGTLFGYGGPEQKQEHLRSEGYATQDMKAAFLAADGWEDPLNYFRQASPEAIDHFFRFLFKGGQGYQWGNPGKEWLTYTMTPLENVAWQKFADRASVKEAYGAKYYRRRHTTHAKTKKNMTHAKTKKASKKATSVQGQGREAAYYAVKALVQSNKDAHMCYVSAIRKGATKDQAIDFVLQRFGRCGLSPKDSDWNEDEGDEEDKDEEMEKQHARVKPRKPGTKK